MGITTLLACQREPQLTSIETQVLKCSPLKQAKAKPSRWQVILQDTVIFPEGGGQPSDTGFLTLANEVKIEVLDMQRNEVGEVVHVTDKPVEANQSVTASVDWDRRLDHMQQHTGQHLLSAVVEQVAGADTVSWELHPQQPNSATSDTVTIDLSVPSLTPEQMSDIEAQCNAHIRAARGITQLVLDGSSKGQAERQAVIEKGNLRGKLPPADVIQDLLRLIEIEGVDINPCGGTHLSCTSQLQVLKLVGLEKSRNQARLRFMVGGRVIAAMGAALTREAALNKALGCGPAEHEGHVKGLVAGKKDSMKTQKSLMEELAGLHGQALAHEAQQQGGVACFQRPDADLQYLSLVAGAALEKEPESVLLLVSPTDVQNGRRGQAGVFLLAGPSENVDLVSKQVAECLGGKGGGRSGRYQGKAPQITQAQVRQAVIRMKIEMDAA
ncbi:Alanyl-tRNA editing protein Aarsd1 [Trebouxia sp. C0010 RCD-2024]